MNVQDSRIVVIWNPGAGRAEVAPDILSVLKARGDIDLFESTSDDAAAQRIADLAPHERMVVAAGGDGTVHVVVNSLMKLEPQKRPVLAVLPLGTANDFCESLAMPDELLAAIARLDSSPRRIDVGELQTSQGAHFFANMATGGNSDRVTSNLTPEIKERWGPLCYLRGAIPLLTDLIVFDVILTVDGQSPPERMEVLNIMVANGRTNAGRLPIAPQASLEDGYLDLILVRDGTLTELAGLATRFAVSDYLQSDKIVFRRVKEVEFASNPQPRFSLDGNLIDEDARRFLIHPGALHAIVGADYQPQITEY